MILKKKGKHTPGVRHQLILKKNLLYKNFKLKFLIKRLKKKSGRNSNGHITIRHRGGGSKKLFRLINWYNPTKFSIVVGIEYDPNRSCFIARIFDLDTRTYSYILAVKNMYPGTILKRSKTSAIDIKIGNQMPLLYIPAGSLLSAVGTGQKQKPLFARAAGTACQLLQKGEVVSKIRIPSGKIIYLSSKTLATLGVNSNDVNNLQIVGKAGKNRLKGIRPTVRGVAMNPVDHPHGGAGGRPSVTPWGKPTKGKPTSKTKYNYGKI